MENGYHPLISLLAAAHRRTKVRLSREPDAVREAQVADTSIYEHSNSCHEQIFLTRDLTPFFIAAKEIFPIPCDLWLLCH
jgi:hypothetical protein